MYTNIGEGHNSKK